MLKVARTLTDLHASRAARRDAVHKGYCRG
ncbi:hypothetical protein FJ546_20190 [Mesorhizobium sp. B2-4-19]|nr:hypothetical protein FJ546_20190 [Mesorhizobium sp. B2-4-19]